MIKNYRPEGAGRVLSPVINRQAGTFRLPVVIVSLVFFLSVSGFASSDNKGEKSLTRDGAREVTVEVENFGKVTDFYYRGAQPKDDEYSQLAALGVKTIIDLRDDPKGYARGAAESAGLRYINLPMSDKDYPAADAASRFLTLVNAQENWPVYVHCAGGRHRTGAMTAVFRMTNQQWDVNRAYEEMKDYDFYTRWGHKAMKKFVFDYYRELNNKAENPADSYK